MIEEGEDVDVCFMDFTKAVRRVNQRLLLVKLRALGLGIIILNGLGRSWKQRVPRKSRGRSSGLSGSTIRCATRVVTWTDYLCGIYQRPARVRGRPEDRKQFNRD